jgi:hypothetical protein
VPYQVTVQAGLSNIVLPDGLRHRGGDVVTLTNDEHGQLSATAISSYFSATVNLNGLPLPSGTALSGQVPVATGTGEASAWGSPLLPNGTTATTQTAGDSSAKLATDSFVATAVARPFGQAPVLYVEDYGAKGDCQFGSALVAVNASTTVTDANASWSSADVGKTFVLSCNNSAGTDLVTTIASVQSATSCTLMTAPLSSLDQTGSGLYYAYGTDDTAAFNSCITAAVSLYATPSLPAVQGTGGKCLIQLRATAYMIAGPQVTTNNCYAQIPLPQITVSSSTPSFSLGIHGAQPEVMGIPIYGYSARALQGTVLFTSGGTPDGSQHVPSVIGGAAHGIGSTANFTAMMADIRGITFSGGYRPANCYLDLGLVETCHVSGIRNVPNGGDTSFNNNAGIRPQQIGLIMPQTACTGISIAEDLFFFRVICGIVPGEHTRGKNWTVYSSVVGVGTTTKSSIFAQSGSCDSLTVATSSCVVGGVDLTDASVINVSQTMYFDFLSVNIEESTATGLNEIDDQFNKWYGVFNFHRECWTGSPPFYGLQQIKGAVNVKITDLTRGPGNIASPAVPAASTAAVIKDANGIQVLRDCFVIVTGGTGVTVSIDGVSTALSSGPFIVPSNKTINLGAYSVAPTLAVWAY